MSFIETVQRCADLLRRQGRISLRGLKREFDLDDDTLEDLVGELVDVQQVAAREGKVLSWIGPAPAETSAAAATEPPRPDAAERRQLTVLFCDLVGSTRLAAGLDPEDWRELVRDYQEAAAEVVGRFEGHVAQYLGDGLLVYFGWPRAHEDDAERAVRAGLEIAEAVPARDARLAVRIGIHTGPVVVGEMGAGASRETLAMGDTTNVAARLQAQAQAGGIVVSDATLRLVPGMFVANDLGTPRLEGVAEPIRAHTVLRSTGVRSRLERAPGELTPLLGRDLDLGLLLERWEQAQEGQAQTVLLSGEAGLGKSRLLHAFRERLEGQPHLWLEGRCSFYTQGTALHPVVELLEGGLGFAEGEGPETKLQRLEGAVGLAGLSPSDVIPLIAPLLSVPLPERYPPPEISAELQRKRTLEAFVSWGDGLARQQPVVLVYEDLHWCDPSTLDLLGLALERSSAVPILMILTFRPDFEHSWPARSSIQHHQLSRLTRRQARAMVRATTRRPLADDAVERIVERADGVPLFLEELTRSVAEADPDAERGADAGGLPIPATLQDSLMARLDRLSAAKSVAQTAATIGREFRFPLLETVAGLDEVTLRHGLDRLVAADIILQRGIAPDITYVFRHALLQDAAYESLLKARRRELHGRIARALEESPDAPAEMVARHYEQAGLRLEAAEHYLRAGEHGLRAGVEGPDQLRRGIEILAGIPSSESRDHLELRLQITLFQAVGEKDGWGAAHAFPAAERAAELSRRCGATDDAFDALQNLFAWTIVTGRLYEAERLNAELREFAQRTRLPSHLCSARSMRGACCYLLGRPSDAVAEIERSFELEPDCEPRPLQRLGIGVIETTLRRSYLSLALCQLGRYDRCREAAKETVEHARQLGRGIGVALGLRFFGQLQHDLRIWDAAESWARQAEDFSRERGFKLQVEVAAFVRISAAGRTSGRSTSAELRERLASVIGMGEGVFEPGLRAMLAGAQLRDGLLDDARETIRHALDVARSTGQHYQDVELNLLRGEILRASDADPAEVEAALREAVEVAHGMRALGLELRAATSLARFLACTNREREAGALLQPVYDRLTEGFDVPDTTDAKALLAELEA